ncbi:4705_t:CDS:1, partial [Gigaspora rosea]
FSNRSNYRDDSRNRRDVLLRISLLFFFVFLRISLYGSTGFMH